MARSAATALWAGLTSQIIKTGQPLLINEDMEGNRAKLAYSGWARTRLLIWAFPFHPAGNHRRDQRAVDGPGGTLHRRMNVCFDHRPAVGVAFHNARLFEEARQARAAAEEADAAKSSFLSTVSMTRTPLTSVLGFAKIITAPGRAFVPMIPDDDRKGAAGQAAGD